MNGTKIYFSNELPQTFDAEGYEALDWVALGSLPSVKFKKTPTDNQKRKYRNKSDRKRNRHNRWR